MTVPLRVRWRSKALMSAKRSAQNSSSIFGVGDVLGLDQLGVDPDHEHFLVIRSVEDADAAPLGQGRAYRQRKLWSSSSAEGCLKLIDLAALGIHARHHVLDRAVLAGGIHRLKNDEDRPTVSGIEPVLGLGQCGDILGE